jgi:hypothetical protein
MKSPECESMRPLISAAMDGELRPEEADRLRAHLAHCAQCRHLLGEYRRLRDQLRILPSSPEPPPQLRQRIWREIVQLAPARRARGGAWSRLLRPSVTTAVLSVALLVVLALVLTLGYQRALPPTVAGSSPEDSQLWPVYQPILITFNKPMDHESVIQHLRISPAAERQRLPLSWRGTTLVIGADPIQQVSLLPDTVYTVAILAGAQDQWGHPLGRDWVLRFRTTSVIAGEQTPAPRVTEVVPPPDLPLTPTAVPAESSQSNAPNLVPSEDRGDAPPAQLPASEGTTTSAPAPTTDPEPVSPPVPQSEATPEPTPSPVPATPEPTASPVPATPEPTASPVPATPEPTASPVPTTPEPIPVTGAFAQVYWGNQLVQQKLGQPLEHAYTVSATEMGFQRGLMIERFDSATIYVLVSDGTWFPIADTWAPENWPVAQQVDSNLWSPGGSFGAAWLAQALGAALGYAIEPEAHLMAEGARIQPFENGLLLLSDRGFVYMLLESGTWEQFPAATYLSSLTSETDTPSLLPESDTPQP